MSGTDTTPEQETIAMLTSELSKLRAEHEAGVLAPAVQRRFVTAFSEVPGLGGFYNIHHMRTADEVLSVIGEMSKQLQRLFDSNAKLSAQVEATDNMLAAAGQLFGAMQQAATKREDAQRKWDRECEESLKRMHDVPGYEQETDQLGNAATEVIER